MIHQKVRQRSAMHSRSAGRSPRFIVVCGLLLTALSFALFILLESTTLWANPGLIQDRLGGISRPLTALFPERWLNATFGSKLGLLNGVLYVLIVAAMFGVYLFALRRALKPGHFRDEDARRTFCTIFLFTVAMLLIFLFVRGMMSPDIFSYIWYGRLWAVDGVSPFTHTAQEFAATDTTHWLQWVYWKQLYSPYGPVWVMFAGLIAKIAQVGDGDIVNHLIGHRLLASLSHLLNIWLVWRTSDLLIGRYWHSILPARVRMPHAVPRSARTRYVMTSREWQPGARIWLVAAYAWNPLLLIEFGAGAHNDSLMLSFVLAGIWLHLAGKWKFAACALACAVLVKFVAVCFLPGYIWLLWHENNAGSKGSRVGLMRAAQASGIALATWVLFYLPFWEGPATLQGMAGGPTADWFAHSIPQFIVRFVPDALGQLIKFFNPGIDSTQTVETLRSSLRAPVRLIFLAFALVVAAALTWRARSVPATIKSWGLLFFVLLTVGVSWFLPWYVSWLIVPAALAGPGRLWNATQMLAAGSLSVYVLDAGVGAWTGVLPYWVGSAFIAPPLIYLLVSFYRDRRHLLSALPSAQLVVAQVNNVEPA
ncbi:MAG: hypothetical protein M3014_10650 [Chloroflexota bacterium]|nr:hypothetical protein [Chloroflexota bacterium]